MKFSLSFLIVGCSFALHSMKPGPEGDGDKRADIEVVTTGGACNLGDFSDDEFAFLQAVFHAFANLNYAFLMAFILLK